MKNLALQAPRSVSGARMRDELAHQTRSAVQSRRHAGSHLIVDLYGASALDDLRAIEHCLHRCVEKSGATLLHIHLHPFEGAGGVSGVAVLAESHISIHTWPEHRYAAVDVFMCGAARPDRCIAVLRETFVPEECVMTTFERGKID